MKKGIDLSNLPSNWHVAELGNHLERIANGLTVTQNSEPPGLPVSRIETISDGTINFDRVRYVQGLDREKQKQFLLRQGDILFSHINSDLHLGKTAVYSSTHPLLHGMNLLLLRTRKETLHPYYLHYLLNYYRREGKFIEIAQHAVNQSSLNQKKIVSLPIPVAPPDQQQHIVAEIEKQFSRLDEAVANLKRVKANLKRYKAAVLKAAVEGKLTEDWRKQHPDVEPASKLLERILAERRAKWSGRGKYKEPIELDTSALPKLPDSWAWVPWESVLSPNEGAFKRGPFGSALTKSIFVSQGYKIYEQYCPINDDCSFGRYYIKPEKFEELRDFEVKPGDFLISCSGVTLGRITKVPRSSEKGIINQALLRVRLNGAVIQDAYFLYLFRSPVFQKRITDASTGTAIPNVKGVKELKAIPISLPPLVEQPHIVAEVDRRLSVIDELEAAVEANLTRADRLRQSILAHAFSGNLACSEGVA